MKQLEPNHRDNLSLVNWTIKAQSIEHLESSQRNN